MTETKCDTETDTETKIKTEKIININYLEALYL